jgi:hypothetical protein
VLMGAHDRAVDHRVLVVGVAGQVLEDSLPDPGLTPWTWTGTVPAEQA